MSYSPVLSVAFFLFFLSFLRRIQRARPSREPAPPAPTGEAEAAYKRSRLADPTNPSAVENLAYLAGFRGPQL